MLHACIRVQGAANPQAGTCLAGKGAYLLACKLQGVADAQAGSAQRENVLRILNSLAEDEGEGGARQLTPGDYFVSKPWLTCVSSLCACRQVDMSACACRVQQSCPRMAH